MFELFLRKYRCLNVTISFTNQMSLIRVYSFVIAVLYFEVSVRYCQYSIIVGTFHDSIMVLK